MGQGQSQRQNDYVIEENDDEPVIIREVNLLVDFYEGVVSSRWPENFYQTLNVQMKQGNSLEDFSNSGQVNQYII